MGEGVFGLRTHFSVTLHSRAWVNFACRLQVNTGTPDDAAEEKRAKARRSPNAVNCVLAIRFPCARVARKESIWLVGLLLSIALQKQLQQQRYTTSLALRACCLAFIPSLLPLACPGLGLHGINDSSGDLP